MVRDRGTLSGTGTATRLGGGSVAGNDAHTSRAELRAGLHRRLDALVNRAADSFQDVIKESAVSETTNSVRGALAIEMEAANLVSTCEALLRLVSELKVASIVQDVRGSVPEINSTRKKFDEDAENVVGRWIELRDNVKDALTELERHYYASIVH